MSSLNEAFAPPSAEELARAAQDFSGSAHGSAYTDDLITPVPTGAPALHFGHPEFGQPTAIWRYTDASGATLGYVARFDPLATRKQIIPHTFWRDKHGVASWRWRSWTAPRPLYGLDRLALRLEALVIVAEGEKAADAAGVIFPDAVAVTSPGGSEAARKADWTLLSGRRVLIWPDADDTGLAYARDVRSIIAEISTE